MQSSASARGGVVSCRAARRNGITRRWWRCDVADGVCAGNQVTAPGTPVAGLVEGIGEIGIVEKYAAQGRRDRYRRPAAGQFRASVSPVQELPAR